MNKKRFNIVTRGRQFKTDFLSLFDDYIIKDDIIKFKHDINRAIVEDKYNSGLSSF